MNVKQLLSRAKTHEKRHELQAAAELYQAVLVRFPGNESAARRLAKLRQRASPDAATVQHDLQQLVGLFNDGQVRQALELGQKLAQRYPDQPLIYNVLGAASKTLLDYDSAIAFFSRAIGLQPDYAEVYNNLGTVLDEAGRSKEALASYKEAIRLQPDFFEAFNNLGNIEKGAGHTDAAIACYRQAIHIQPSFAPAHSNLGGLLGQLGRHEEAIAACTRALEYAPDSQESLSKLAHQLSIVSDWDRLGPCRERILAASPQTGRIVPFEALLLEDNPRAQRHRAQSFARRKFQSAELPSPAAPDTRPPRLRIGYFSADFHNHATMYLIARMLELHDKERFEIIAYSYGPNTDDAMRKRARNAVSAFHEVGQLGDREVAELGRSHRLDIAVDLKGYTQDSRLGIFSYRVAPLQVSYLGYPGTTGASFIDYLVADHVVIPPKQRKHYSEQLLYLPNSYQANDDAQAVGPAVSRSDVGLPDNGFVFCCFNNSYKIRKEEFTIWMRLLGEVKGSVLWLIQANDRSETNLRREAENAGIEPDRLLFAPRIPRPGHLARLRLADLFLDTFFINAHTTASDALICGVPLVTKAGAGFPTRVAASLLSAVGLSSLITESDEAYEQLALSLARNPDHLTDLKNRLQDNCANAPLFDPARFTRDLEAAYDTAYQCHLEGRPPALVGG